jgi:glycosyltransferase involved in cell wall biosynthesis
VGTPGNSGLNEDVAKRDKISVIIPSYNSRATIEACVQSVLATGYRPLEILIVDDASTDGADKIAAHLASEHPDIVHLLRQPENGGPARARNAGARYAGGRFYFFLDSDTVMNPRTLDAFAWRITDADAVVGIYDPAPLNDGAVPAYKALVNNYFFSRNGVIPYEVFDSSRAGIRAEVFDAVGGFSEQLEWGMDCENEELGYRIHRRYRMLLDPQVSVRHHFPDFRKLTSIYFLRVALWMEIFVRRRKFETGGVTSAETGISSAAILLALVMAGAALLPLPQPWPPVLGWLSAGSFAAYLYGYWGFLRFVAGYQPLFLFSALAQNMFFTCVIAAGAGFGLLKVLIGRSSVGKIAGTVNDP